jgi:hypothetical protein
MSELIFTCARTGRAFNSGFRATRDDLLFAPPTLKTRFLCRICGVTHEFGFAAARVGESPTYCRDQ